MNVSVPPTTILGVAGLTVIVVSTGAASDTVTLAVPVTLPLVAVTVVVPAATAVNTPVVASIVPTVVLLLLHVTVAVIGSPY